MHRTTLLGLLLTIALLTLAGCSVHYEPPTFVEPSYSYMRATSDMPAAPLPGALAKQNHTRR